MSRRSEMCDAAGTPHVFWLRVKLKLLSDCKSAVPNKLTENE
jgi:hypothetical protein